MAGLAALVALGLAYPSAGWAEDFSLGRLRGEVRDSADKPVWGVVVLAVRTGPGPASVALTASDARGFFGVDGLPAGEYRVETWRPGYAPFRLERVQIGGPFRAFVDITLPLGQEVPLAVGVPATGGPTRIAAAIVDEAGRPLAGARVRVEPVGLRADPVRGETDAAGSVTLAGLAPGIWRLSVSRAGAQRLTIARFELGAGTVALAARLLPQSGETPLAIEDLLPPAQFPDR
jgi:hypothetical protein